MNTPQSPTPRLSCTGAILAGGTSSRMGHPKQDMRLTNGKTMIEYVHEALHVVCGDVVIAGECVSLPNCQRVTDRQPRQGPLAGIEALLASQMDRQYLVCPCDVPLITSDVLEALLKPNQSLCTVLRIAGSDSLFEPLPMRISADALELVRSQLQCGRRSVQALIEAISHDVVEVDARYKHQLTNINTMEEYQRLVAS